jgi:hypothetical protein
MTTDKVLQHRGSVSGVYSLRLSLILTFLTAWLICWAIDGRTNPANLFPVRRAIQVGTVFASEEITDLTFLPQDRKITATNFWLCGTASGRIAALGREALRLVRADIDHDGDTDLVGITSGLRLLVWLNNGKGDFTPHLARPTPGLSRGVVYSNLTDADGPLLSFEPSQLVARLIPVIARQIPRNSCHFCLEGFSPRAARAPPRPLLAL